MKFKHLMLLILPVVILAGCTGKKIGRPDTYIRQDVLTEILTDLYITDGLLNVPEVRRAFSEKDSIINYMEVIEDHGYSIGEFESNLDYYFVSQPKKLEQVYDDVLARLSEMEAKNTINTNEENPILRNLWPGKTGYRMPDDGTANAVEFSIPSEGPGLYSIKARITIFDDDQTIDPIATARFWYDDGSETGYAECWDTIYHEKSGHAVGLSFEKMLTNPDVTHIKGKLIDYTPQPGHWEMHSSISGIVVTFDPANEEDLTGIKKE